MTAMRAASALVLALVALAAVAARGELLTEPVHVYCNSTSPVTLNVQQARVTIAGVVEFNTRLYYYGGVPMMPGPTLHFTPGEQCNLTITNSLSTSGSAATCTSAASTNSFHCPDTTNVHTHGLHISPTEDDVSSYVLPGNSRVYSYNMPSTHLMGTHWYHAHRHGSTSLHAGFGLHGTLLVDAGSNYTLPSDLSALYNNAALNHVLVMSLLQLTNTTSGDAVYDLTTLAGLYSGQTISPQVTWLSGSARNVMVVNGQYQPTLQMKTDEVHLLRFVGVTQAQFVELELSGSASGSCSMTLLARDGVFQDTPYVNLTTKAVVLLPGTRADVAVKCGAGASGQNVTIASVIGSSRDTPLGTSNLRFSQSNVMTLQILATGTAAVTTIPSSQATRPSYLTSLTSVTSFGSTTSSVQLQLGGGPGNLAGPSVNQVQFPGFTAGVYVGTISLNNVYKITIGDTGIGRHPYHQHVNHFQIQSTGSLDTTGDGQIARVGEWRDVALAIGITILVKPVDYTGLGVMHCHILQHEDLGMMALWNINSAATSRQAAALPLVSSAALALGVVALSMVLGRRARRD